MGKDIHGGSIRRRNFQKWNLDDLVLAMVKVFPVWPATVCLLIIDYMNLVEVMSDVCSFAFSWVLFDWFVSVE
ncbi:hypothetical protein HanIR_Chr14g0717211 [Helianthus annuus]|nr:hypothetical protein HanIR_Chr14g0717211 [Helianthus annuus]